LPAFLLDAEETEGLRAPVANVEAMLAHLSVLHPKNGRHLLTLMGYDFKKSISCRPRDVRKVLRTFEATHVSLQRFNDTRVNDGLARINAFAWFDCEITPKSAYYGMDPEEIAGILLARFDAAGIPRPSYVLSSGRGIWGVWLSLNPLPARTAVRVKRALQSFWGMTFRTNLRADAERVTAKADALRALWTGMDLDATVGDMPRVHRIAGTINEKSGTLVRLLWPASWHDVERLDFEDFANVVLPYTRQEIAERKAEQAEREARAVAEGRPVRAARPIRSGNGFYAQVADELLRVAAHHGQAGLAGIRRRCLMAHHVASAWASAGAGGDARTWAEALADYCVGDGLTLEDLVSYLVPVEKRLRRHEAGETSSWGDGTRSTVYGYGAQRIVDEIGITEALAAELGLVRLRPADPTRAPMTAAERQRKRRAAKGSQSREELARLDQVVCKFAFNLAFVEGLTITEIAKVIGCSRNTAAAYLERVEIGFGGVVYTGPETVETEAEALPQAAAMEDASEQMHGPRHAILGLVLPADPAPTRPHPTQVPPAPSKPRKAVPAFLRDPVARLEDLIQHHTRTIHALHRQDRREGIRTSYWDRSDREREAVADAKFSLAWEMETGRRCFPVSIIPDRPSPCDVQGRRLH